MQEPVFPLETYERLFGLKKRSEREFVDDVVQALGTLDRALLPAPGSHPLLALLAQGYAGVEPLLVLVERGGAQERLDAVDALAHLLAVDDADTAVDGAKAAADVRANACARLRTVLSAASDVDFAVALAKTLALAGDEVTLRAQLVRLGDDDPGVVATAARLLGLGKYQAAAEPLAVLVSPERIYESRWVIWALGEIGDVTTLPALERALAHSFRVVDCLIAVGKIGQLTSIPQVQAFLTLGLPEQRDAAARALAMILDSHRSFVRGDASLRQTLVGPLERDLADPTAPLGTSTRFFLLLCLARLGQKLDESRVRRYLALGLPDRDVAGLARLLRVSPQRL
jgi:hypothetical protein